MTVERLRWLLTLIPLGIPVSSPSKWHPTLLEKWMKLTRLATICLFATSLATAACVPDPLEGFDDMGTTTPTNSTTTDMGGTPTDMPTMTGSFNPEFLAVTAILRPNCLLGGCHGQPPGAAQVFIVGTGTNATDAEIQTILSSSIPGPSGNRMIAAGSPDTSEIYVRVSKPAGDPLLMGAGTYGAAGTPLTPAQVTTIQTWIANGAIYTQ